MKKLSSTEISQQYSDLVKKYARLSGQKIPVVMENIKKYFQFEHFRELKPDKQKIIINAICTKIDKILFPS